ncbi:MAG: TRAP transporter substrate-binding protein DctP [Deltaproteobacteria bacterium]|nr:TRAP transporter substrate-binding protein DctP [Deltaproteobacteria bacterium]
MARTIAAALLCVLAFPAAAGEQVVKLATLAPQGSSWHRLLRELSERWSAASGGAVKLRIYAGGTQGSEVDMVRKMGVGQLQAAALTSVGLRGVVAEPGIFTVPGMVEGETEYRALFPRLRGKLEELLLARGCVAIHWVGIGTAYVFCDRAHASPAGMGGARVFAWEGDPAAVEAFRAAGFRPVVLSSTDLVASLQTGMVSCVIQPPAYALTARTFDKARHLMDYPWAWMMGVTVVRRDAWERIPAEVRPRLLEAAREIGARLDAESRRLHDDAIAAMRKQGLRVEPVDRAAWRAAAARTWTAVRGEAIPAPFFDEVVKARDELRRGKR